MSSNIENAVESLHSSSRTRKGQAQDFEGGKFLAGLDSNTLPLPRHMEARLSEDGLE